MNAVIYFAPADADKAKSLMVSLKVKGVNVHWVGGDEFQAPRDLEAVDEVYLVSNYPAIEAAYESAGAKIVKPFDAPPEAEPSPRPTRGRPPKTETEIQPDSE